VPAAATVRPATAQPALPYLPGVDVTSALRRLRGNVPQYRKFLDAFLGKYTTAIQDLTTLLEQDQRPAAHLHAHSLKGLAAAIGADAVTKAAQALESALKNAETAPLMPLLEQLAAPLAALVQAILQDHTRPSAPANAADAADHAGKAADMQALVTEAQQLANLLANDDAKAIKCLATMEALVNGTDHAAAFAAIAAATRAYDFGAALRDLQAWAAHVGTDIHV
jgi:HPt (histidine-containing phosphotransfer) domain-containing protein